MAKRKICLIAALTIVMIIFSSLSVSAAEGRKVLKFEKVNGKMVMDSIRSEDGNWFMDFTNMIPGVQYHDKLEIRNESDKKFELYFQIIPLEQDEKKDSLLDMIYMDIDHDGKQIYTGTASGRSYKGHKSLTNVILLGIFEPNDEAAITTDFVLDKNVGIEYNNVLTKVDWKFMVREINDDGSKDPPENVYTGDQSSLLTYLVLFVISLVVVIGIIVRNKKDKKGEDECEL